MQQNPLLFPHWSIEENLQFAYSYCHNPPNSNDFLKDLNCLHLLKKYPHQLSGGEKQRIAFIRTLAQIEQNGLVLLDEPFNAMDIDSRKTALSLLDHYRNSALIFLVTHDLHEIYQYADRLMLIDRGQIIYHNGIDKSMASGFDHLPVASRVIINDRTTIIYADDVSIGLDRNPHSSIMHQIPADINAIDIINDSVIVNLTAIFDDPHHNNKQQLLAQITQNSLQTLQLKRGQRVLACFKASSYRRQL